MYPVGATRVERLRKEAVSEQKIKRLSASVTAQRHSRTAAAFCGSSGTFHRCDELQNIFYRRVWQHAVAKVENVARAAGGLSQHLVRATPHRIPVGEEHSRIEIALHGPVVADGRPRLPQFDSPVDADNAATR